MTKVGSCPVDRENFSGFLIVLEMRTGGRKPMLDAFDKGNLESRLIVPPQITVNYCPRDSFNISR